MKTFLVIFLLFLNVHISWSYSLAMDSTKDSHTKLGIGFRSGQFTTFLTNTFRISPDLIAFTTYETWLGNFKLQGFGFKPQKIDFRIGFQYKNFGISHNCFHYIDTLPTIKNNPGHTSTRLFVDI